MVGGPGVPTPTAVANGRRARNRPGSACPERTAALAVNGEFGNMCAMSFAAGKDTQTDCSINGQYLGHTYCFGSAEAMGEFMKNPKDNLAKAQTYYSSSIPGRPAFA